MDLDPSVVAWTRALLTLPAERGVHFAEEWDAVKRRIEAVHRAPVTHETEPAGAPRLQTETS